MGLAEPYTPKLLQLAFFKQKYSSLGNHTLFFPCKTVHLQVHWDSMTIQRITHFFPPKCEKGLCAYCFPPKYFLVHYYFKCSFIRNTAQIFSYPLVMAVERHINLTRAQHSLLFLNLEYFILGSFTTLKHNESQAANYRRGNKTLNYTQMLSCTKRTIICQNHCQIKVPIWKLSHICVWCSCSCLTAHKFCFPFSDCYSNDIKEQLQQNDNNQSVKSSNCRRSVLI